MAVVPLQKKPTKREAEEIIKKLASDGQVAWSKHCKERMKERGITIPQILNCLLKGTVTEEPYLVFTNGGGYATTMEKVTAGDWLKIVACMKFNQTLLVITAIN